MIAKLAVVFFSILIFFLGEIYAIFFRNFITFYSLDSKQISKFHEINMILFCQLIDKNFGFYSVKNGIVFFDLEKVESENSSEKNSTERLYELKKLGSDNPITETNFDSILDGINNLISINFTTASSIGSLYTFFIGSFEDSGMIS